MSLAQLVVTAVVVEKRSKSEVARTYGIGRTWVHELVRRYETEGDAGLQPRSRRPLTSPRQVPRELEDEIVALRKQLIDAGLDAGAHTIAWHLEREGLTPPSPSTIWRILVRRGFVTPEPRKRPKSSYVRFEADQPNERWQADTTHWQLADHTDIEICNIIDDHSRLTIASVARTSFKAADIVEVFTDAFAVYGLPASVLTDNAAIFTGTPRGRGQVALEKLCATLDIRLHHSRAYHPQTCGKVERLHQTMKKWLTATDPAPTIGDLQTQLDTFTEVYNHHRPHRAIDRRTPATAYTARSPAGPGHGVGTPHHRLRRDVINNGTVTLRHNSRLHHIGIGKAHTGTPVYLLVADLHIRVIDAATGQLLRDLTLDPDRDYQPRGVRPGLQPRQK
jgi:transposase InsO family protein